MKDSAKLSLKCLGMVDLDICITYLNTLSLISHLFNNNRNILVYPVNFCTNYTNIVTQYTLVFLVYFGSSTITKTFFTKCCMVGYLCYYNPDTIKYL